MKITAVHIANFRGLANIKFRPSAGLNVIAGPNAIGKTSLLEALRLHKAFLHARYQEEPRQVLTSLGATTPNVPWAPLQVDMENLAGDARKPITVRVEFSVSDEELLLLKSRGSDLGLTLIRNQLGQSGDATQFNFVQFLSSEAGKERLATSTAEVLQYISSISQSKSISSTLTLDPIKNAISGSDQKAQLLIGSLEAFSAPGTALFSYYPADRAMPSGEVNIQIGSADMKAQVESHLGNAPTKYQRLKQSIVNQLVLQNFSPDSVRVQFDGIFDTLLPGKSLETIKQKPTGNLTVLIRERSSGRLFDIDSMSSGEKGVLLTYYLMKTSVAKGGIVLLDEPELHLNPAVCARIVPFLVTDVLKSNDLQAFVCTHSPEILGAAFEREDCSLFHLRSERDISPVLRSDQYEALEILHRLGATTADVLFSKGAVFLEGDSDTRIVDARFFGELAGYKVTQLGGRGEVEKAIRELQQAEQKGRVKKLNLFIFDHDNKPTTLVSTSFVKVVQLKRYCIENYLLDNEVLYDCLREFAKKPPDSRGVFEDELAELAIAQLTEVVAKLVYAAPEGCGIRQSEIRGKTIPEIAAILRRRLDQTQEWFGRYEPADWETSFVSAAASKYAELLAVWQQDWVVLANGKRLISDLQTKYEISTSLSKFKEAVAAQLSKRTSESWEELEELLKDNLLT
jgi:predicted ATPase